MLLLPSSHSRMVRLCISSLFLWGVGSAAGYNLDNEDQSLNPRCVQANLDITAGRAPVLSKYDTKLDTTSLVNEAIYQRHCHSLGITGPALETVTDEDFKPDLRRRDQHELQPVSESQSELQTQELTTKPRNLSITTIYSIIMFLITLLSPIILTSLSRLIPSPQWKPLTNLKTILLTPLLPRKLSNSSSSFLTLIQNQTGTPPTKGLTLYILSILLLTTLLTFLNHQYKPPHIPSPSLQLQTNQLTTYLFQRTGVYAFAFLPLTILFSSRNNLLTLLLSLLPTRLGISTFSHSTYIILHRWIGRLCAALAILHSILALPLYFHLPGEPHQKYWIWGSIGTVALGTIVLLGGVYFRKRFYETFLLGHILLSVLVLVGCWYHVSQWVDFTPGKAKGYGAWILGAAALWGFDRFVRVVRVVKNGLHKARVIELGTTEGEYVRVDIPMAKGTMMHSRPGMHVYAQFPGLSLAGWKGPWENHPFSVVPTALLTRSCRDEEKDSFKLGLGSEEGSSGWSTPTQHSDGSVTPASIQDSETYLDVEKGVKVTELKVRRRSGREAGENEQKHSGITLLVKKSKGLTKHLKAHDQLLTLLDGPYPNNSTTEILRCERILLIGGGIGITGVIPWISYHTNVKLAWSLKENARCLVDELQAALERIPEKEIRIGKRFDIDELLAKEIELGWSRVGVVVCGPGGLCDDVRAAVALAGSKGETIFELEVDAYSW